MVNTQWVLGLAFILFLAALPLVSVGATTGNATLWWTGLALMVLAGLLPPVTRYLPGDEEEEEEEETEEGDERAAAGGPDVSDRAEAGVSPGGLRPHEGDEDEGEPPERVREQREKAGEAKRGDREGGPDQERED